MKSKPNPMRRKPLKRMRLSFVVAVILGYRLLVTGPAQAAPQGGVITSGSATISQSGATTNVNQSTNKATINWRSFSTSATETVNFNQPSASSITLNRVIGNEKSVLQGALNATGRVFLINSNGVLMTKGSTVNTAGFLASTLNITDDDFNAGTFVFRANGSAGSVINLGTITAREGGFAALLGNSVSNQGVITATKGTVSLNSGDRITLNFNGDSLVSVSIDEGTLNALVENKQAIYADGGSVIMTAKAADDLLSAQVNNSGIIQAHTIGDLKGSIELYAHGGTTRVDGTLDASAPTSGDGGSIETSGDHVKVADSAVVTTKAANGTTGSWLIDPDGFTISASGDMTGARLSSLLGNSNITISSTIGNGTDGDIDVNQAVTWSTNNVLTLNATNAININKSITATGTNAGLTLTAGTDINVNAPVTLSGANAALAMNYGGNYHILTKASYSGTTTDANGNLVAKTDTSGGVYGSITLSGSNSSLSMNGTAYTLIHDMSQLDLLDGYNSVTGTGTAATLSGSYALAQDLDASGTTCTSAPIGKFSGMLAGLGHTIHNLSLNNSTRSGYVGLIGQTVQTASFATSVIRDIGLVDTDITSTGRMAFVGGLLGFANGTTILSQTYTTGAVTTAGGGYGGGLVGATNSGTTITYSYSEADVVNGFAGGLIGYAMDTNISNSHATGNVTSTGSSVGGLVGYYYITKDGYGISSSYAQGVVNSSSNDVGGLIGQINASNAGAPVSVTDSFATGAVTGFNHVGGLIGSSQGYYSSSKGTTRHIAIDNCYATGIVTGTGGTKSGTKNSGDIGGLIGWTKYTDISRSHATGDVISAVASTTNVSLNFLGGLVGYQDHGSISDSYATGDVVGQGNRVNSYMGGLVGYAASGTIERSYATGDVTNGYRSVGGLAGTFGGTITDSWASGNVSGHEQVGGLLGSLSDGAISGSTAYGNVTGTDYTYQSTETNEWITEKSNTVGGLAGANWGGDISHSAAMGNVTGGDYVGGFVGVFANGGSITDSIASGRVSGSGDSVGGIAGSTKGDVNIDNSYWDTGNSGQGNAVGTVIAGYDYEGSPTLSLTNTRGLTSAQFRDVQYYRDGTINQVLAYRADASHQASLMTGDAQQQNQASPLTLSSQLMEQQQPSIDNHIVYADSANYSVDIRAINADGVEFELEDKPQAKKK